MDLSLIEVLLRRYGRLILPELGAFLVSNFENGYDVGRVSFSPFLRYNDGKFEQYLELDYALPREEARKAVIAYVDEINSLLAAQGQCVIPAIGILYQDNNAQLSLQITGSGVQPNISEDVDDALSLDIPLDNEIRYSSQYMTQEYAIPDGSHFEQTSRKEASISSVESENVAEEVTQKKVSPFSLDGALADVSYNAIEQDSLPSVSNNDVPPVSTGFDMGTCVVETSIVPTTNVSGFEINDCLSALESYKSANETQSATDCESVTESTSLPFSTEGTVEVLPNELSDNVATTEQKEVAQEGVEESIQREPMATVRTTVHRAKEQEISYDSPWLSPQSTPKRGRKGVFVLILLILLIVAGGSDVLWFKQVTPYIVEFLETNGVLLRERPSVEVAIDGVQQSDSESVESDNTTVLAVTSEIEKEYKKRVQAESNASTPVETPTDVAINSNVSQLPVAPTQPVGVHFYLVLGCFRNRDNAENYSLKLQREGFQTLIVQQRTGMHAVTIESFSTRLEAQTRLNTIQLRHPEVWILEQ